MFRKKLITIAQMKNFYAVACCESYAFTDNLEDEIAELERRWPKFHEQDEEATDGRILWGKNRFGRLPPFFWDDNGKKYTDLYRHKPKSIGQEVAKQVLLLDAKNYKKKFLLAFQETQKCAQHHIHKKAPKKHPNDPEIRIIPNACLSFRGGKNCKHDFPQKEKMHEGEPVLVCYGIAKAKGLKRRGNRCMIGRFLVTRNSEWLDGTSAGLSVGLSGSNTDVKLNDLVPITRCTHEDAHCSRRCARGRSSKAKKALRKAVCRLETCQSQINGYFGGYIGKRQKCGKLETRKCVDKMHVLREQKANKSPFEQQRAVSGRMITDVEMNSTLRGAVEEFNLCMNLRVNDVLFAECIRTFPTIHLDCQTWFRRLDLETNRCDDIKISVLVPPTRRPNVRSLRSKAPWVDTYGFRPLQGTPFALLSPFEFCRYWDIEAVGPPWKSAKK